MNIPKIGTKLMGEVKEHDSTLLTCGAVIGVISTVATAIAGSFKAKDVVDKAEGKITKKTIAGIGKCYIWTAVTATGTILCIVFAHKADMAKYAALAAMCAKDSKTLNDIIEKEKKEHGLTEDDKVVAIPIESTRHVRFYDSYLDRITEVSFVDLMDAIDYVNAELFAGSCCSVVEFYERLYDGHSSNYSIPEALGEMKWYTEDGLVQLKFDAKLCDDMQSAIPSFGFSRNPEE